MSTKPTHDHAAPKAKAEKKVDQGSSMSFPASDPPAVGGVTSTEPAGRPVGRKAVAPTREEIEAARRGQGHKDNS